MVDVTRPTTEERLRRNAESKCYASHDGEPWSSDELDVLMVWSGSEEELAACAELLGRTIEACRQRFYEVRGVGHIRTETTVKVTVSKWLVGFCFVCGRFGDLLSDGTIGRCEECVDG